jgi:uncharacterized protein (TIGR00251 family)
LTWYRWDDKDLLLDLRVQPRASRDEFGEPLGNRLKLRLTAPPVEGKANAQLIRFLAAAFGVTKSRVHLESGASSRNKRVRIQAPERLPLDLQQP